MRREGFAVHASQPGATPCDATVQVAPLLAHNSRSAHPHRHKEPFASSESSSVDWRTTEGSRMGALDIQVVIDCSDPHGLAEFWAAALDYVMQPPPQGFDSWEQFAEKIGIPPEDYDRFAAVVDPDRVKSRILFQKVPETKTVKNRVHLDIDVAPGAALGSEERKAAAWARSKQLTAHGATLLRELNEPAGWCLVMADPEGNEFCLH
jgi:Glyoxalase-like domain